MRILLPLVLVIGLIGLAPHASAQSTNETASTNAEILNQLANLSARLDTINATLGSQSNATAAVTAVNVSFTQRLDAIAALVASLQTTWLQTSATLNATYANGLSALGNASSQSSQSAIESFNTTFTARLNALAAEINSALIDAPNLTARLDALEQKQALMYQNLTLDNAKLNAGLYVTDRNDPDYGKPLVIKQLRANGDIMQAMLVVGENQASLSSQSSNESAQLVSAQNRTAAAQIKEIELAQAKVDQANKKLTFATWLLVIVGILAAVPNVVLFGPDLIERIKARRARTLRGPDLKAQRKKYEDAGVVHPDEVSAAVEMARKEAKKVKAPPAAESTTVPTQPRRMLVVR